MKSITVIGHMHLNPDNREPFEMMMEDYDVNFRYPRKWKGSLGETREDEGGFSLIRLPVIPLSYIPLVGDINESGIVWIDEEPVFPQTDILLRKSSSAQLRIVRSAQNIVKRDLFRNISNGRVNKKADIICAVSEGSRKCVQETLGREYVPIIPLHIPERFFRKRKREFAEDGLVVGYAARMEREKGTGWFTDFAAKYGENAKFIIAGDGSERNRVLAELKKNRVKFEYRGVIDHLKMDEFYADTDIFINMSVGTSHWKEQQGRAALEALASGCAVISSDCGDLRSTLDGYELFVKENDTDAVLKTAGRLTNDSSFRFEQLEKGAKVALRYSKTEVYKSIMRMIEEHEHNVN